jgi:hypothetical protein
LETHKPNQPLFCIGFASLQITHFNRIFLKISISKYFLFKIYFIIKIHLIFTKKIDFIKVVTFADLLIFADSANSKFADFADLLKSAKNE